MVCAHRAAPGAPMAGSPDVADLPQVRKLLVSADRYSPDLSQLPHPAITTTNRVIKGKSTRRGGAAMPHALITSNGDVRAEAAGYQPFRFCAVHPSQERTKVRIRGTTGCGASPLPALIENNVIPIAANTVVRIGGGR